MYIYQSSGLPDVLIGEPADIGNLSYKHVNEIFSWDDLHDKGINDFFFYEGEYRIAKNRSLCGMYGEIGDKQSAKVLRCERGSILLVIADVRPDSPTYLKCAMIYCDYKNEKTVYCPRGLVFGFLTKSKNVSVRVKYENKYDSKNEIITCPFDPSLNINWGKEPVIISAKDKFAPTIKEIEKRNLFQKKQENSILLHQFS